MKKLTAILASVVMLAVMAVPVYAVNANGYVDSVTGQPAPGIVVEGDVIGHIVKDDSTVIDDVEAGEIIITAYTEREKLPESSKKALEEVYGKLENGEMTYPAALTELLGEGLVAKDLFDVSVASDDVLDYLDDGYAVKFTLDANVADGEAVAVAAYVDGQWVMATDCVNNNDGTITVTMEDFGPVAVFVKGEEMDEPVGGEEPAVDGECKICQTFFPYLGNAPIFQNSIFEDTCVICFVIITAIVVGGGYTVYRIFFKKKKDEDVK